MMMKNDFEIYHYKQSKSVNIDFHSHDFYEIYCFIDGNVTYYIEEKVFELMPGDILVIPPGKLHKPVVSDGMIQYERIVLWLNTDYIKSLDKDENSVINLLREMRNNGKLLISTKGEEKEDLIYILNSLVASSGDDVFKKDLLCSSYISIFLAKLIKKSFNQSDKNVLSNSIVPKVIEYINDHLTEKLTSDNIAEHFFISKFHLHRLFKDYTNVSMYDYVISKRIVYAKSLIRHGYNVTDACFASGFKDYSNFYKAFLRKTGISPKEFKQFKNNNE